LPRLDAGATLSTVIDRLALDDRAARALALLYGARLLGRGEVAAATVARVLGDPPDDAAWETALGRELGGQLGLWRARSGRLALSPPVAGFLDGDPPRVKLVPGGASDAELPLGNIRLAGGVEPISAIGARLAQQYGYDVALITASGDAPRARLRAQLVEARLHGAWPLVEIAADPAVWRDSLDDGPTVVVVRGDLPAALAELPEL
jgi:hypothetical protein